MVMCPRTGSGENKSKGNCRETHRILLASQKRRTKYRFDFQALGIGGTHAPGIFFA